MFNNKKPQYAQIRPDTIETINDYVTKGWEPGGFVGAVLENDLKHAVGSADAGNRAALADIVDYCWNEIPAPAWGSPEKVKRWLAAIEEAKKEPVGDLTTVVDILFRREKAEEKP